MPLWPQHASGLYEQSFCRALLSLPQRRHPRHSWREPKGQRVVEKAVWPCEVSSSRDPLKAPQRSPYAVCGSLSRARLKQAPIRAWRSCVRPTRIGDRAEHTTILSCGKTSEALEEASKKAGLSYSTTAANSSDDLSLVSSRLRDGLWGIPVARPRATRASGSLFVGSGDRRAGSGTAA